MSSRCVSRLLLFLWACGLVAPGQEVPPLAPSPEGCAEYHVARVEFLLGCCGSLGTDYPGPRFSGRLDDLDSATLALDEIAAASSKNCGAANEKTMMELALDGIGARLWRAELCVTENPAVGVRDAVIDIDDAVRRLQEFVEENPAVSSQIWHWIATSYVRAGRSWEALVYLRGLPPGCCSEDDVEVFAADILYRLSMYEAASRLYSKWLSAAESDSLCGNSESLKNAAELRLRGFQIPSPPSSAGYICVVLSKWRPYVRLPAR